MGRKEKLNLDPTNIRDSIKYSVHVQLALVKFITFDAAQVQLVCQLVCLVVFRLYWTTDTEETRRNSKNKKEERGNPFIKVFIQNQMLVM